MSWNKTLDRHFFCDSKHEQKLKPDTAIVTAETKFLGLSKKQIQKLTIDSIQELLWLDQKWITSSHSILFAVAKSNEELLNVLWYKATMKKNKVVWVSMIS